MTRRYFGTDGIRGLSNRFPMTPDLAMRVGIDVLIALAFWAQMRRYPAIGGPGWWAVASFLSILGSGGLWLRSTGSVFWAIVVGTSLIVASAFAVWFGLRSYLGLPVRRWHLFLAWLGVFGAFCALTYGVDTALGRQIVFSATVIAITVGGLRDLTRAEREAPRVPELRAVRMITVFELLTVVAFAISVPLLRYTPDEVMPVYLFIFLMTLLVRMALYNALVSHRLRVEGDRARQTLQVREADQRALIENLGAGVMVFRPDNTLASINSAKALGFMSNLPESCIATFVAQSPCSRFFGRSTTTSVGRSRSAKLPACCNCCRVRSRISEISVGVKKFLFAWVSAPQRDLGARLATPKSYRRPRWWALGYLTEPAVRPRTKYRWRPKNTASGMISDSSEPAATSCHPSPY